MKTIKIITGSICALATLLSCAACGASSSSSSTLEVMTAMDSGSKQLKTLQSVTSGFEKENPNVTVKLIPNTTTYEQDLKVRLAGNNAPDIFNTIGWSRNRYSKFLVDLSHRSWSKNLTEYANGVLKNSDGSLYGLPLAIATGGLLYNEDVLNEAGVDSTKIRTWDDFLSACAKVKSAGDTCVGLSGKENTYGAIMANDMADGIFSGNEKQNLKKGSFNTSVYKIILDYMKKMVDAGYINNDYSSATPSDLYRSMAGNKLAFSFLGLDFIQGVESYNPNVKTGLMPYPSPDGKPYFVTGELAYTLGVSKTSKNQELALKYIDYLAKPANMSKLTTAIANASAFSNVKSNFGKPTKSYEYWVNDRKTLTQPYFDRTYLVDGIWNTMCTTSDGVLTGQLTPEAASEQMKTQFDSLYPKNTSK